MNKEWAASNGYQGQQNWSAQNNLIVIEDKKTGFKNTLLDLEQNAFFENNNAGNHVWEKVFVDGWVSYGEHVVKVDKVRVGYIKPPVTLQEINIDFEQYVLAVMEYISGQTGKFVVLTSGEKKGF